MRIAMGPAVGQRCTHPAPCPRASAPVAARRPAVAPVRAADDKPSSLASLEDRIQSGEFTDTGSTKEKMTRPLRKALAQDPTGFGAQWCRAGLWPSWRPIAVAGSHAGRRDASGAPAERPPSPRRRPNAPRCVGRSLSMALAKLGREWRAQAAKRMPVARGDIREIIGEVGLPVGGGWVCQLGVGGAWLGGGLDGRRPAWAGPPMPLHAAPPAPPPSLRSCPHPRPHRPPQPVFVPLFKLYQVSLSRWVGPIVHLEGVWAFLGIFRGGRVDHRREHAMTAYPRRQPSCLS
jgi:hypothetical protein